MLFFIVITRCLSKYIYFTIHSENKNLKFSIYRKPIQTDIIISNSLYHPYEHKLSSINYLLNRLHSYPLIKRAKETGLNTIKKCYITTSITGKPPLPQKQNVHTDSQRH
jgi:hypothetical protein